MWPTRTWTDRCLGQSLQSAQSYHIRCGVYRWRTKHTEWLHFLYAKNSYLIYIQLLGVVFLFPFWEICLFNENSMVNPWDPTRRKLCPMEDTCGEATMAVFPQNGSAGHTAIPPRPALTRVIVMLTICFNPTKIRVGNLKALKEKKKKIWLYLWPRLFFFKYLKFKGTMCLYFYFKPENHPYCIWSPSYLNLQTCLIIKHILDTSLMYHIYNNIRNFF